MQKVNKYLLSTLLYEMSLSQVILPKKKKCYLDKIFGNAFAEGLAA